VDCVNLASNENPFGPSPKAIAAMRRVLANCNLYPDNVVTDLQQKLSEHHRINPENIVVTAGGTALLELIARAALKPGLNAITSERSFIMYPIATQDAGSTLTQIPMRNDGFDLHAIAAAIDDDTRIIYLANPNNPTGTIVTAAEVDRFLEKIPDRVLVVLDEAYYEFANCFAGLRGVEYSHGVDYVKQGKNVVVLRSFSKAHGLAGVRVGYGLGPAEFMSRLARLRTTFSVSTFAQAAALAALKDEAHIQKTVTNNVEQAEFLAEGMIQQGYQPVATWANFLYCELNVNAEKFAQRMQAESVIIRPLGRFGAPTAIRVTIGTPEQNQKCLKAFRKVIERAPVR
jgi:histidinol-phosphate aminotransferase